MFLQLQKGRMPRPFLSLCDMFYRYNFLAQLFLSQGSKRSDLALVLAFLHVVLNQMRRAGSALSCKSTWHGVDVDTIVTHARDTLHRCPVRNRVTSWICWLSPSFLKQCLAMRFCSLLYRFCSLSSLRPCLIHWDIYTCEH